MRPKARHSASMARWASRRNSAFILAKSISIGLRSGLYGGKYKSLAPAVSIALRTAGTMDGKVVHHDGVASSESRNQDLLYIGNEQLGVGGTVEYIGCDHAVLTKTADEARRFAMSLRHGGNETLAPERPSMGPSHVGLDRSLVEKDQSP